MAASCSSFREICCWRCCIGFSTFVLLSAKPKEDGKTNITTIYDLFQAPPGCGSGRYESGVFGAQESRSARQVLCGDASRLILDHFSKHLSSVLGRTELCHEVRNPGPPKPQIIRNKNHHLALFDYCGILLTVCDLL